MAVDVDVLEQIRERLRVSTRVGDERIEVATRDDDVVLLGAVATPEEATVAGQLAEEYATSVVNELQVDRGLREGVEEPLDTEPASPAGDEVLVGSTDMLAGPDAAVTGDLADRGLQAYVDIDRDSAGRPQRLLPGRPALALWRCGVHVLRG